MEDEPVASISYLDLSGGQVTTTLHFSGSVKGNTSHVLLNGGSTQNFIHPRMTKFLKLPIQDASKFSVMVGDGNRLQCLGVVRLVISYYPGLHVD